ncbi:MAG TPA: hypothetical protein DCP20_08465 [Coriobacteriia bacterium]|nr:MAG: hypothetical protein XD74_0795 [Actinobacteria bacterium 66_15]HAL30729.1 hypothetical protein [Coriobacteriia bacterium]
MRVIRLIVQIILAVMGWVLFAWLWWRAIQYGPTEVHLRGTLIVAIIDLVIVSATILWIIWNKDIYRRKGARTTVPPVEFDYAVDALGTPVHVRVPSDGSARSIVIDIADDRGRPLKVFTSAEPAAVAVGEA